MSNDGDSPSPSLLRSPNHKNTLITIIILIAGLIAGNFLDSLVKGDDPIFVKLEYWKDS
ncbi:MAG: hypothetical protein FIO02_06925 [Nitrosopumilales archaeon]|nr:hypothetical protein [Nitrosopumilales archaeon]